MSGRYDWLPGLLAQIAAVAGVEAALAVAKAKGGSRAYVPPRPADDHWLVRAVGRAHADAIAAELVGGTACNLLIPKGAGALMRRHFDELRAEGVSILDAARRCGAHERTAFLWERGRTERCATRAVAHQPSPQISIFDVLDGGRDRHLDKAPAALHSAGARKIAPR
jgi:hypothetical protein